MKCVVLCLGLMLASVVATLGQTSPSLVEVSGTVVDVNGEAVPKAKVTLRPKDGAKAQTTTSDAVGAFAGPAFNPDDIAGHLAAFKIGHWKP